MAYVTSLTFCASVAVCSQLGHVGGWAPIRKGRVGIHQKGRVDNHRGLRLLLPPPLGLPHLHTPPPAWLVAGRACRHGTGIARRWTQLHLHALVCPAQPRGTRPSLMRPQLSCCSPRVERHMRSACPPPTPPPRDAPLLQAVYIASSRELKRLDSLAFSPIFQHYSESLHGLVSIRAFRKQAMFLQKNRVG